MKIDGTLGITTILTAFFTTFLLGFIAIPILKKLKAKQITKPIGPVWHKSKTGTPTMGGIFLILGVSVAILSSVFSSHIIKNNFWANLYFSKEELIRIYAGIFCAIGLGVIGFIDDYSKIIHHQNKGITAMQKTILKVIVVISYFVTLHINGCITTIVSVPSFDLRLVRQ